MQEHVDTTEVVSRGIDLLTKVLQVGILSANGLGEFEQQRSATASRVVHLIDVGVVPRCQTGQQF